MITTELHTEHLTLVPASARHVAAELEGPSSLAALLGADVPASWPPGEYDEDAQQYFLECLTAAGAAGVGWYSWYAVRPAELETPRTLVGGGGYFGPPTDEGLVEIGYSVCPEWRGLGFATQLASALAAHAARQPGVTRIVAHTTETNPASIQVLERSGFLAAGAGEEPGSVLFEYVLPIA
jgi:[ribosomal protein S5]-alanine N-acetyltransferase